MALYSVSVKADVYVVAENPEAAAEFVWLTVKPPVDVIEIDSVFQMSAVEGDPPFAALVKEED